MGWCHEAVGTSTLLGYIYMCVYIYISHYINILYPINCTFTLGRWCFLLLPWENWNQNVPLPTNCSAPALMLSSFPLETSQGEAFFFLLRITRSCALISIFFTSFWTLLCWSSCSLCYQSLSIGSSCVFSSSQNNSLDFTSSSSICGTSSIFPSQPHFLKELLRYLHFLTSHWCVNSLQSASAPNLVVCSDKGPQWLP